MNNKLDLSGLITVNEARFLYKKLAGKAITRQGIFYFTDRYDISVKYLGRRLLDRKKFIDVIEKEGKNNAKEKNNTNS